MLQAIEDVQEEKGWDNKEMAARLGLTRQGLERKKKKGRYYDAETLLKLKEISGWPWDVLMEKVCKKKSKQKGK